MSKSAEERLRKARETASFWMGCVGFAIGIFAVTPALVLRFGFGTSSALLPIVAAIGWLFCIAITAVFVGMFRRSDDGATFLVYIGTCLYFIVVGFIPEAWGLALARLVGLI
ncbi:hypothetical protein MHM88_12415 [Epibacterium sp. MM17-32]|uniref:hypothetical protein n=1 Tax=Epibacterium sp. MM17-32 TaxID=2917734 RepID=UPI001EF5A525|nr:hypothetical protein [Epibacterium sp. MM17-32]MCG7628612.1 hypothetical protein [Epibacterium sp. MM17-32]